MSAFNLFGNAASSTGNNAQNSTTAPTGGLFGNANANTSASPIVPLQPLSSHLAAQPTAGLFGNPTPAPTTGTPGGGLFGGFGMTNNVNAGAATSTPAAAPVGGGLFGNTTTTPAPTGGLFGGSTLTPASGATGTAPAAPAAGGLFGGFGQPKPADQNAPKAANSFFSTPATNAGVSSTTPAPPLFGATPAATSTTTPGASGSAPATTTVPAAGGGLFGGGLFGKKPDTPAAGTSVTGAAGTTSVAPSLFGGAAAGTSAMPAAGTSATTSTPSLFGNTGASASKPEEKKDAAAPAPAAFGLFGSTNAKKDEKPATGAPTTTTPAATTSTQISVPAPSILRGKTLEEIVNKWTAELETHVKEFGQYAGEVAVWDRALVESGNNLSALYATLLAAEREQNDVDQSLEHIEQQQRDLAATLDAYEKVTDEILGSSQPSSQGGAGGLRSLDTGPADTERDRNYMIATELHGNLDDLSASLTQMIESVNALSPNSTSNLSASTADSALSVAQNGSSAGNDDPMTQIAQVLANHLESLQWIDGAVREVEAKVVDVERRVRSSAGDTTAGLGSPRQEGRSMGTGNNARSGNGGGHNARFGMSGR